MTITLQPADVRAAAAFCAATLRPVAGADWQRLAAGLDWSCRFTIIHTQFACDGYATQVATEAIEGRRLARPTGDVELFFASLTNDQLLTAVEVRAAVLAAVAQSASAEVRAWHSYGIADPIGFVGMGCVEILVHTDDIARAFDLACEPPADLCRRVVDRMFPWAPTSVRPWDALRWATGRHMLPGLANVGPNWRWLTNPLNEWDGQRRVAT